MVELNKTKYFSFFEKFQKEKLTENWNTNRILIIDGLNTFIRAYTVNPTLNDDGLHIGGIQGFLMSITSAIKMINPNKVIIVFDGKGGSLRRKKLYPNYKAQRTAKRILNPDNFTTLEEDKESQMRQLSRLLDYLNIMPVNIVCVDNIEADDAIAYLTMQIYNTENDKVYIMSSDKDFLQLVSDNVYVWSPTKKIMFTPDKLKEIYKLNSKNYLLYRILDGDASDNIAGIKGIGLKTLEKNFPEIFNNDTCYDINYLIAKSSELHKKSKVFENISTNKDQVIINEKLMQLYNVDISSHSKLFIENSIKKNPFKLNKVKLLRLLVED